MKKIFALLIGILIYHNCFSEEVWEPSLTYEQLVLKAKAGSPITWAYWEFSFDQEKRVARLI